MTDNVAQTIWNRIQRVLDEHDERNLETERTRLTSLGLQADNLVNMLEYFRTYSEAVRNYREASIRRRMASGELGVAPSMIEHVLPLESKKMLNEKVALRVAMATESISSTSLPAAFISATISGLEAEIRLDETKKLQRLANLTLAAA